MRKKIASTVAALAGLAALAITLAPGPAAPVRTAEAQSQESCRGYRICIEKRTIPGSNVAFPFVIDIEQIDTKSEDSEVGEAIISQPSTVYLSDGEEIGVEFYGEATITELPVPGWQLVDIDCEGTSEFDVEIHGSTLEIYYLVGTEQSILHCTFVNQRIEQPQLNLGGLFAGQPTPLPTAPAPAAVTPAPAQGISPPRTGDGGLK
jgi:hypothetical protein